MPNIELEKLAEDPWEFKALLNEDDEVVGEYMVSMSGDEYERYGDDIEPHELVRATIVFLLAHEEPEMISAQFDLSEVEQHFPDYPDSVRDYL